MSFDRGKRFKCPLPEDLSYNQKYEKLKISGDTVDGCALDNGEIGTVLATGVFPIQIDFFYFEYKIIDIAEDIIIGKQFDFMLLVRLALKFKIRNRKKVVKFKVMISTSRWEVRPIRLVFRVQRVIGSARRKFLRIENAMSKHMNRRKN